MKNSPKYDFLLYHEVYTTYLNLFPILKNFPRSEKFTLRQRIEDTFLELLLAIEQYQKLKQTNKSNIVKKISYLFDKGKLLIRISHDLHIISQNNYLSLLPKFEIIGKLIGGMLKKI
ncbi:MAG: four helix bundle protein [Nanoarchaeota archaeon]